MRHLIKYVAVTVGLVLVVAAAKSFLGFQPAEGFVPNEAVAVKIAVAVWEPIYGTERIAAEKPYVARLTNGVWIVQGTLRPGSLGGVAEARIAKADARILSVTHGQ